MKKVSSVLLVCFFVWIGVGWAETAAEKELAAQRDFYKDMSSGVVSSSNTLATWAAVFISAAALGLTVVGIFVGNSARDAQKEAKETIKRIADDFESKKAEMERNVEQKVLLGVSNRLMELRFLSDAERKIAVTSIAYWTVNPTNTGAAPRINRLKSRGFKNILEHKGNTSIANSEIAIIDLDSETDTAFTAAGFVGLEAGLTHIKNHANIFIVFTTGQMNVQITSRVLGDKFIFAGQSLTLVSHAVAATQAMEAFQNPRLP
jgi:hypothetical protein